MNLLGKHWVTFGLKRSGKSNFNKWLLSQRPKHMVFDPTDEYKGYNRYIPDARRGDEANEELGLFLDQVVYPNKDEIDYLVLDEVNRYTHKRGTLDGAVGEAVDLNRHFGKDGMGVGFISRKPQQVHTDIRELAEYVFIFQLQGASTMKFLDEMREKVQATVRELEPYQCVMLTQDRELYVLEAVSNMDGVDRDVDIYDF